MRPVARTVLLVDALAVGATLLIWPDAFFWIVLGGLVVLSVVGSLVGLHGPRELGRREENSQ